MKQPLPKNYDHKEAEPRLQQAWEANGVYAWDSNEPRANTFVIDTPPPTVSGVLHMGHIFSYTQADFVARFQRMSGKTVFYPIGFDDNGLPTERLVEKIKGVRGNAMQRNAFVALCREVVQDAEEEFRQLFKSVALSVDWSQEYQTISDDVRKLSQMSFVDLLQKGEAYRDFRPTYWDWVDQTAIAQAEIENKELPGTMNEILFVLQDGTKLSIATTRPELLGACVAVMYHPEDPNAGLYKSKMAITPLFGVRVPMIADDLVERDKGTGLVMCCTFGDDTDKEWWRKHQLPLRSILGEDGKIKVAYLTEENVDVRTGVQYLKGGTLEESASVDIVKTIAVFEAIGGLKPKQANAKMLEMLAAEECLLKQTNIAHTVKCAERSGTPIEIIPTYQWFIKVVDKKEALLAKGAECHWYPDFMRIRLNQWIEGLKEDWCISRQRYFGVPFPVWFVFNNKLDSAETIPDIVYAPYEMLPVDPMQSFPIFAFDENEYHIEKIGETYWVVTNKNDPTKSYTVTADKDVMDTWATSSISPQINARGISSSQCLEPSRFERLFPADLRAQAHEIIRTWAFYTIVKSYLHGNTVPWKNLMISGWCLAADKTKMSKSKGNVITPVELIRDKGADVVRYWASTSRLGADTAFSEDLLKIGKKLVTKLWNATSFAAAHLDKLNVPPTTAIQDVASGRITETLDKWILSRLQKTIAKATQDFTRFEYCDARVAVEEFFWKDFCDNYLELVKARAYGEIGDEKSHASAHLTLYYCLNALLRLFAPFIPHVTEALYSHIFDAENSVHARGTWPQAADYPLDEAAELSGIACVSLLEAIRKAKSEKNVSIKYPISELRLSHGSAKTGEWKFIEPIVQDLKSAGNVASLQWGGDGEGIETDDKRFALTITFGEQADVA